MPKVLVTESHLSDIADAIREKSDSAYTYKPSEMAEAIMQISGGGGGGETDIPLFIDTMPTKVTYNDGETLSTSGIVVKLQNGGIATDVTEDCIFEPADGDTLHFGDNIVKVIYGSYIRTYKITVIGQAYTSVTEELNNVTSITKTINCNVGDLIIAALMTRGTSSSFEPTLPSGWTVLKTVPAENNGTYQKNIVLFKRATSTTETFTSSQPHSGRMLLNMIAIPGAESIQAFAENMVPEGEHSITVNRPQGLIVWAQFSLTTNGDEGNNEITCSPYMREISNASSAHNDKRTKLFIDQSITKSIAEFSWIYNVLKNNWVFIPIVVNGVDKIFEDGIHSFPNYASMVPLKVAENGRYAAPRGYAYSPVSVNVSGISELEPEDITIKGYIYTTDSTLRNVHVQTPTFSKDLNTDYTKSNTLFRVHQGCIVIGEVLTASGNRFRPGFISDANLQKAIDGTADFDERNIILTNAESNSIAVGNKFLLFAPTDGYVCIYTGANLQTPSEFKVLEVDLGITIWTTY